MLTAIPFRFNNGNNQTQRQHDKHHPRLCQKIQISRHGSQLSSKSQHKLRRVCLGEVQLEDHRWQNSDKRDSKISIADQGAAQASPCQLISNHQIRRQNQYPHQYVVRREEIMDDVRLAGVLLASLIPADHEAMACKNRDYQNCTWKVPVLWKAYPIGLLQRANGEESKPGGCDPIPEVLFLFHVRRCEHHHAVEQRGKQQSSSSETGWPE